MRSSMSPRNQNPPEEVERSPWIRQKRSQRMSEIIRTAAEVFAVQGYDGTNMEDIAARMNMRGPSLYHYASSKEQLFLTCVESINAEVIERLAAVADSGGAAIDRLHRLFHQQVLLEAQEYREFLPLFLQIYLPDPELRDRVSVLRRRHGEIFERVAKEAVEDGEVSAAQWKRNLLLTMGAIAYVRDWYEADGVESPDQLAEDVATRLISAMVDGFRSADAAEPP